MSRNSTLDDTSSLAETFATDTNDFKTHHEAEEIITSNFNQNSSCTINKIKSNLHSSLDSLNLLNSSCLCTKNLTFNMSNKEQNSSNINNKTLSMTLANADSLFDVTLWADKPDLIENQTSSNKDQNNLINENQKVEDKEHCEVNWSKQANLNEYELNQDLNPEIIKKSCFTNLELIQELCVRYLKPPTPPPAGEILIVQEQNKQTPPAPPLVVRQVPARPRTPQPLVVREAPPEAPKPQGVKLIRISGKHLPPPPRKVVLERIAPLPNKPQSVILEKWLPYSFLKDDERKILFPNECECIF